MHRETRRQTSDYLDFDMALNRGMKLLKSQDKKFKLGFLIILGINVGLRISDILKLRHRDLQGDTIKLHEKKTGKFREIKINQHVRDAYAIYKTKVRIQSQEDFLFLSKVTILDYTVPPILDQSRPLVLDQSRPMILEQTVPRILEQTVPRILEQTVPFLS